MSLFKQQIGQEQEQKGNEINVPYFIFLCGHLRKTSSGLHKNNYTKLKLMKVISKINTLSKFNYMLQFMFHAQGCCSIDEIFFDILMTEMVTCHLGQRTLGRISHEMDLDLFGTRCKVGQSVPQFHNNKHLYTTVTIM